MLLLQHTTQPYSSNEGPPHISPVGLHYRCISFSPAPEVVVTVVFMTCIGSSPKRVPCRVRT